MNILFASSHPHLPQILGGVQTSTDQLVRRLMTRGHNVSVLGGLMPYGPLALRSRIHMHLRHKLDLCKASYDRKLGYRTWRTWFPWNVVEQVCKIEKTDVIVIMSGDAVRIQKSIHHLNISSVIQLQNVEFQLDGGAFNEIGYAMYISNSKFTAQRFFDFCGINSSVIYPFMELTKYQTKTSRTYVTFINPHPQKGRDLAFEIAAKTPDIPYLFVQAWPLDANLEYELQEKVRRSPNVKLLKAKEDIRQVYAKTKLLLMPSIWDEAYGRVANEAQISGIPVVASNKGGIPEAVGLGGVILDPYGPLQSWTDIIRKLWIDDAYYDQLSENAINNVKRPELDPSRQVEAFEEILIRARSSTQHD